MRMRTGEALLWEGASSRSAGELMREGVDAEVWILSAVLGLQGTEGESRPSLLPSRDLRRKPCISLVIQGWTQLSLFLLAH